MAMPRESAFLPTIKCSQCSAQVEISMMGEHICGGSGGDSRKLVAHLFVAHMPNDPTVSPPLEADEPFDEQPSLAPPSKFGRKPLPVNTGAASM